MTSSIAAFSLTQDPIKMVYSIKVPVTATTADKRSFTHRKDEYAAHKIGTLFASIIQAGLSGDSLAYHLDEFNVTEYVNNSFDAFVDCPRFAVGGHLHLSLVIKERGGKVIVTLKDNGTGFIFMEKGKQSSKIIPFRSCAEKSSHDHLGSCREAMRPLADFLCKSGVPMALKNRKEEGAALRWTLRKA